MFNTLNSILQHLPDPKGLLKGVNIFVKRDDLIDDIVSGNKWRKLKYNILEAKRRKNEQILTFGGAYSNHLVATAKAGFLASIPTIGLVRGEELNENSNPTLRNCAEYGMKLIFLPRTEYTLRNDKMYIDQLHEDFPNTFIVPEGGANFFGMIGCQEIWDEVKGEKFSNLYVSAGTGTTAAGLLAGLPEEMKMTVVSALKGDFMESEIRNRLNYSFFDDELVQDKMSNLITLDDDVFGGYAKVNDELMEFIKWAKVEFDLPLDKVYTAKTFYRIIHHIESGLLQKGDNVLFVHTGGLQGN